MERVQGYKFDESELLKISDFADIMHEICEQRDTNCLRCPLTGLCSDLFAFFKKIDANTGYLADTGE